MWVCACAGVGGNVCAAVAAAGGRGRRRPRPERREPVSLPGGIGRARPRFGVDDGVAVNILFIYECILNLEYLRASEGTLKHIGYICSR
jgi:hypothetical protein